MINFQERITREKLLEYNSEEAYITRYTGMAPGIKLVRSPFREDKHPSCSFMRTSSGRILLYDFSRKEYTCDFVKAACFRYNCGYNEALRLIAQDYGIIPRDTDRPPVIEVPKINVEKFEKDTALFQITKGEWLPKHLEFWWKYGVTKDILDKFRVYRPSCIFCNGKVIYQGDDNVFAYFYKNGKTSEGQDIEYWKLYFPGKKPKFLSSWNKGMVQGYRQLPKEGGTLVVTKSMKDVMSMYSVGITAIAPNSENMFLPEGMVEELRNRFKRIVVMYDNDRAGLAGMARIRRMYPDFAYVWIDKSYGCKDFSDLYEKYGKEETLALIEKMKEHIKGKMMKKRTKVQNYDEVFNILFGLGNKT